MPVVNVMRAEPANTAGGDVVLEVVGRGGVVGVTARCGGRRGPDVPAASTIPRVVATATTVTTSVHRRLLRLRASLKRTSGGGGPCASRGLSKTGERTVMSTDRLDHGDELALLVAVMACGTDKGPYLGEEHALLRRAGNGDPVAPAKLEQAFVAKEVQCPKHGVLVDADHR